MNIKIDIEPHIFRKIGNGDVSFQWDNWTGLGPLANVIQLERASRRIKIKDFIQDGTWNHYKLINYLSVNIVNTIEKVDITGSGKDCPYWLPENTGLFSTKSAQQLLRDRKGSTLSCKSIWQKTIPIKILLLLKDFLRRKLLQMMLSRSLGQ